MARGAGPFGAQRVGTPDDQPFAHQIALFQVALSQMFSSPLSPALALLSLALWVLWCGFSGQRLRCARPRAQLLPVVVCNSMSRSRPANC